VQTVKAEAQARAEALAPLLEELRCEGFRSANALANALNERQIASPRAATSPHFSRWGGASGL